MQVERVRGPNRPSRDGELDRRAAGESVYALLGNEVLGRLHAAQDLQENRDRREFERYTVDSEPESDIGTRNRLNPSEIMSCMPIEIMEDLRRSQRRSEHSPRHRGKALRAVQYRIS